MEGQKWGLSKAKTSLQLSIHTCKELSPQGSQGGAEDGLILKEMPERKKRQDRAMSIVQEKK